MSNNQILDFLRDLSQHNNREWFQEHKGAYRDALSLFEQLVADYISGCAEFDESVALLTPQECIFRIYRDVRFSPDKSPYKRHMGAYVAMQGGRKSILGGYYLHFEPDHTMVSGGIYMPTSEVLKQLRHYIEWKPEEFLEIIHAPDFVRYFGTLDQTNCLKRLPAGFSADSPVADYLRLKDFVVEHLYTENEVCSPDFLSLALDCSRAIYRFNCFMNAGILENR